MASNSGSKEFDFASDDILCDYADQDPSNHSDPVLGAKNFHKGRMTRSAAPVYGQSLNEEVISTVEKSMEKYSDNLMRFLEGISSRLSQLEIYCYNLDKSIGEMRSDLNRDHEEADSKLKSLEKHLQEVHRSVQILRDKQELTETQKELSKLQLVQKEPSSSSHSQSNEDKASSPASDLKSNDNASDSQNQQLALALPHQVASQHQSVAPPPQAPAQSVNQQQPYYLSPPQFSTPQVQAQAPQSQYLPSDTPYRTSQLQDPTRVAPQPTQIQSHASQPFSQHQQQWPQQLPQQVPPPQQSSLQPQVRPPPTYPPYQPSQSTNPSPDSGLYGYVGAGRTTVQQPQQASPQQMKGIFGAQPGDGYAAAGPHQALPPGSAYMMYDTEGGRAHHFQQGVYPPSNNVSLQSSQPNSGTMPRNQSHPQFVRNHPYNELTDKLVSMGFRGDHVVNMIQRMEEGGQAVDFNAVLDRLNVHSSGAPHRGWSG